MTAVTVATLCGLLLALVGGNRKVRIAGGMPVDSIFRYPWIVLVCSLYVPQNESIKKHFMTVCGGSLIDVYGSVLTAGHCVVNETIIEGYEVKLVDVRVTWEILSPNYRPRTRTEIVPNGEKIRRYKRRVVDRIIAGLACGMADPGFLAPRDVDIALIYLVRFQRWPMTCNRGETPQPIRLSKGGDEDLRGVAILAGFGAQPIEQNGRVTGFLRSGNLTDITMKYECHIKRTHLWGKTYHKFGKQTSLFFAHAVVDPIDINIAHLSLGFWGSCEGDSGGPYMVLGRNGLKQRGVYIQLARRQNSTQPCSRINDRALFVDVANKHVRKWILGQLKTRYNGLQGRSKGRPVPDTC